MDGRERPPSPGCSPASPPPPLLLLEWASMSPCSASAASAASTSTSLTAQRWQVLCTADDSAMRT